MVSFLFQGYNPLIPILIWTTIVLVSFGVAIWSYSYLVSVPAWKKWSLITLRGAVFAILALLLLNPFFINERIERSNPQVNIYLDNSQSISVERGDYEGMDSYREITARITEQLEDYIDANFYLFDADVREGRNVDAEGAVTNLQAVVEHQLEQQESIVASILLSDGIYTQGRNPIYTAQNLPLLFLPFPLGIQQK